MKQDKTFEELSIGDKFDFVSPNIGYNSFFKTCQKTSNYHYVDEDGVKYRVGIKTAYVYHVKEQE